MSTALYNQRLDAKRLEHDGTSILVDATRWEDRKVDNVSLSYRCPKNVGTQTITVIDEIKSMVTTFMPYWIHGLEKYPDMTLAEREQALIWAIKSLPNPSQEPSDAEKGSTIGEVPGTICLESEQFINRRSETSHMAEKSSQAFRRQFASLSKRQKSFTDDVLNKIGELWVNQPQAFHQCDENVPSVSSYALSSKNELLKRLDHVLSVEAAEKINQSLGGQVRGEDMTSILACTLYGIYASWQDTEFKKFLNPA